MWVSRGKGGVEGASLTALCFALPLCFTSLALSVPASHSAAPLALPLLRNFPLWSIDADFRFRFRVRLVGPPPPARQ